MFGHLCVVEPDLPGELDADGVAAEDDVEDVECAVVAVEPVDALAMVRPRPRLAPRTPAPMAVPISGRGILTFAPCGSAGYGTIRSRRGLVAP
jgi:hypothetical protein